MASEHARELLAAEYAGALPTYGQSETLYPESVVLRAIEKALSLPRMDEVDETLLANIRPTLVRLLNHHDVCGIDWPAHERAAKEITEATLSAFNAGIEAAAKVNEELVEALEFYANAWEQDVDAEQTPFGWQGSVGDVYPIEELYQDHGDKARAALAKARSLAKGDGG